MDQLTRRAIKFWWQRITRGWDDSETWSMDQSLAKRILPFLHAFQEIKNHHPDDLTMEQWTSHINEMIWGFLWYAEGKQYNCISLKTAERAHNGINLFAKYFKHLWVVVPTFWGGSSIIFTKKYIAKIILSHLQRFQEIRKGYPSDLTDKKWNEIINEMIWGFEWWSRDPYASPSFAQESPDNLVRAQSAIELFAEYYPNLWW